MQKTVMVQERSPREENDTSTPNKGKAIRKVPELSLHDFPILCSVSTKNDFEVLNRGYGGSQSAPPNKRGEITFN